MPVHLCIIVALTALMAYGNILPTECTVLVVVHPTNEAPAKEFYITFSELYNTADQGPFKGANATGSFDLVKFIKNQPDLVLTNGMAHKYVPSVGTVAKLDLNPNATIFQSKAR